MKIHSPHSVPYLQAHRTTKKIYTEYILALMEELLVHFDIFTENSKFIAKVKSEMGGLREFSARNIDKLMEQVIIDVSEEFENI
jgi:hypothetical protein